MNTKSRYSPRTGRKITRVTRPRMSLQDRLVNLHILLCAQSFRRWPLHVRFFCADVFKAWQKIAVQRRALPLRPADVIADIADQQATTSQAQAALEPSKQDQQPLSGIYSLDYTYKRYKPALENSLQILTRRKPFCHSCNSVLDETADLILVCPHKGCDSTYHLDCLSKHFLGSDAADILPTHHSCPKCTKPLVWSELVGDLSLRSRGVKEQADLFKEKGRRKRGESVGDTAADLIDSLCRVDEDSEREDEIKADPPKRRRAQKIKASPPQPEESWRDIEDEAVFEDPVSRDDSMIAASPGSGARTVEDSDWDEAEVLD
ncbi:hypothetical protein ANO11243_019230 [Dothideomycetidae sp. 11243]|nr:hypothetical protein ANO11243_019230 [fungal sp. No.11243]